MGGRGGRDRRRLDGNYIPGLVLIIAGGGIMYFGSRDG